jgi:tRNA/tmRNA/rRNA uracil-C5-methylase (TrmA/RlmC/RlmD family)
MNIPPNNKDRTNILLSSGEDRICREKKWHNQTYGTDTRISARKFYSIFNTIILTRDKIVRENLNHDNTVLLDYGCGSGYYLISVAQYIKRGIGIDISESYIDRAKSLSQNRNRCDAYII